MQKQTSEDHAARSALAWAFIGRGGARLIQMLQDNGRRPHLLEPCTFRTVHNDAVTVLEREGVRGLERRLRKGEIIADAPSAELTFCFEAHDGVDGLYTLRVGIRETEDSDEPRYLWIAMEDEPFDPDMVWKLVKDFYTPEEVI